jgi:hypothetical protein
MRCGSFGCESGRDLKNEYLAFINHALAFQMPVGFLRVVGSGVARIEADAVVHTPFTLDQGEVSITFGNEEALALAADIDPALHAHSPLEGEIGIIYHDSTYEYIYIKKNDPEVAKLIQDGIAYYKDAPMDDGSTSQDPERLFHEAAACYVEARVSNWYLYFTMLEDTLRGPPADRASGYSYLRGAYSYQLLKPAYGYEERPNRIDQHTTRPISKELRAFCDHELLEDKITDDFDSVPAYRPLILRLSAAGP